MSVDPRITLIKDGFASSALEGLVAADRYAEPTPTQCVVEAATLRLGPEPHAETADQILFGETFLVLAAADGVAFGQAERDGYVGYVDLSALSETVAAPTHRVSALRTYVFSGPSLKTTPVALLSINALVTVKAVEGRYARLDGSGWTTVEHLSPIGSAFETDPAAVAERFVGAPYLWGGRTSLGLDCSGLVQQALYACGRAFPRDSDQQQALGRALEVGPDLRGLERNDLVFWRGHVGIMLDEARLLHANGYHMATAIEPLAEAVKRIEAAGSGGPTAFRRL